MSTPFHELVSYNIGGGWGTDVVKPDSSSIGYVIRGTDIPRVAVGDVSTVPRRFHKASNLASRVLRPGDIVFEVSGGSKGQPVGRALQITERLLSSFDNDVMCASFCKLIRVDPAIADPGFVFRVLQAAYADGKLDAYQVQSTGITNFKWKPFLKHFDVDLPDRDVQERVAAALDVFDDLIENNRRRVEILEEMARSIYREWFVKFRYPGHEDVPLVDSALGPIPEGWQVGRVDSLILLQRGFDLPLKVRESGPIPVVGASGVQGSHLAAKATGPGVVTGRSGTIGVVNYVPGDFWPLNTSLWVREFRLATPRYAYFLLEGLDLKRAASGSAVPSLDRKVVHGLPVVCPPPNLIEGWDTRVAGMFEAVEALRSQSTRLSAIRDLLLPKLVTGQIDVSTLDLDALVSTGSTEESAVAQ